MCGHTVEELIGKSIYDFVPSDFVPVMKERVAQREQGKDLPEIFHGKILCKDGTIKETESSTKVIQYEGRLASMAITRNITERKHEEEEISKLTSVVRFSSELVNLATFDGKMIFLNEAGSKMFGIDPDKVGDYSIMDVISEPFQLTVKEKLLPALLAGKNWEGELQYRNIRTGRLTDVYAITFNIQDSATGKPLCLANVSRDITEHKKAEKAMKQSEEKYRLLADHMKDQVWLMDLDLKVTYISPSVEKILGYNMEELTHLPINKLFTSASFKAAMDFFSIEMPKALAAPPDYILNRSLEMEFRCKDGHTLWGEAKFSFIRDERGKPLCVLGEGRDITERKRTEEKLQQTLESLKKAVGATIQVLVSALEVRDPYTAGHQSRVAHLACAIATEMGLAQEKIEGIRMAGSIHDIGKLSIPAEILTKPTKLTDLEFSLIKVHSQTGYDMLKDVESPWPLAQIVYQHHERMNGAGYPNNLKGNEIILEARIMAVADVMEAMASHRPYRASLGIESALEEIEKNKGILYDANVADVCLRLFREKGYKLP
jgi:PAS domain S-box-containing protein